MGERGGGLGGRQQSPATGLEVLVDGDVQEASYVLLTGGEETLLSELQGSALSAVHCGGDACVTRKLFRGPT